MTAAPASPSERCDIPVSGMTCAGCSGKVQRTLETVPGVSGANVNLMTGTATVSYDPAATSPAQLVDAIRSTGYGAELPRPEESPEDLLSTRDAEQADESRELTRKFIVSAVATALVMIIAMQPGGHDPGGASRWIQLALTLPVVVWAGRHFYTRAWAGFRHHSADMNTLIAVGTGSAFVFSLVMTAAAPMVRGPWSRAARLLRVGGDHHRTHPARQSARGAREEPDLPGGAQTGQAAARHCPSRPRG